MSSHYNIMNELAAIESALEFHIKLKKEFEDSALEHYKNRWIYKIFTLFFSDDTDKIDFRENDYYLFKYRYKGFKYFAIENAIDDLSLYKIAIERNNSFEISEYDYIKFLSRVRRVDGDFRGEYEIG